ncbi:hypothetical protein Bca52824_029392 [Brassica carinata]|uniref:Neprosin PEP catalytic domain-containing protein n=1 Tax=Brassica carinata TaxID=52824 RepID=A0A8X7VE58_BRACI|nr:hypothetical protein Bca52824_029392 [Brassica carinata]
MRPSNSKATAAGTSHPMDMQEGSPLRSLSEDRAHVSLRLGNMPALPTPESPLPALSKAAGKQKMTRATPKGGSQKPAGMGAIAGVRSHNGPYRGVEAWFDVLQQDIAKDQASYSSIYIGSGSNNEINFISAGWMVNPSLFGDGRTWTYGFWKGKDGKGCYNTACSGFVHVSKTIPIVQPIDFPAGKTVWLHYSIHQDKNTGNWWLTELGSGDIGYWPKKLFNLLNNGANMVGAGGTVQASPSGSSPPMGKGQFPNVNSPEKSAGFTNIEVLDSNYKQHKMNYVPTEVVLDSPKCYGLTIGKKFFLQPNRLGFYFNYGGPGGNSCGV